MPSLSSTNPNLTRRIKNKKLIKRPCLVQSLLHLSSEGHLEEAVGSLHLLAQRGIRLNSRILSSLLQKCANSKSLKEGKWVHLHLKLTGLKKPTTYLSNHLINMYLKCGDYIAARKLFDKISVKNLYSWNNMLSGYTKLGMLKPAMRLFDKMPERDVVSWNTMVIAFAKRGFCYEALRTFSQFQKSGIGFNGFSFSGILTVCVKLKEVELTRQVHCQILVAGFLSNMFLSSSLLDAYAKSGSLENARALFDEMPTNDILAWTTLISGYAQDGDMMSANQIFDQMPEKNSVSWTALISGYARKGMGHKSLELFRKMMVLRINPDQFTFSSCLCASASIPSLKHGQQIHAFLIKTVSNPNTIVMSTLIDMYSRCGHIKVCQRVFGLKDNKQDVVLWNTMISALAQHGLVKVALGMFGYMIKLGVNPDRVTFIVLLNACSRSGLVQEGLNFFEKMAIKHGIYPDQEHYACLVDLLGRAARSSDAIKWINKMSFKPDDRVYNALLGVCKIHGYVDLGREVAEKLIELLDP